LSSGERCRLDVWGGADHLLGEQVTITINQNPKYIDNNYCYYGSMDVTIGGQKICTASGFNPGSRSQICVWDTIGQLPGIYSLSSFYGGHSDNCVSGNCNIGDACCDCAQTCYATVNLHQVPLTPGVTVALSPEMPTPTTFVPTPTPSIVLPTPTFTPDERCRLGIVGGDRRLVGEQVTISVIQNPKYDDNNHCYYGSMDVTTGGQKICTAFGFNPGSRIQTCTWDTSGRSSGTYTLSSFYGGHSDNCEIHSACCDNAYTCTTSLLLVAPNPDFLIGWNRKTWQTLTGRIGSDLPGGCFGGNEYSNNWFTPFYRGFSSLTFPFIPQKTYFISCRQPGWW
jgi:hypothetical protein